MKWPFFTFTWLLITCISVADSFTGTAYLHLPGRASRRWSLRVDPEGSVIASASSIPGTSDVIPISSDEGVTQQKKDEPPGGSVLNNAALVAGNMVGAGVLALPHVTSAPGFLLSSAAMVFVWGYCLATSMLVAECAGNGRDSIQQMAEASVGSTAGHFVCAAFLASNYLLMVAYISQGASMLSSLPVLTPEVCGPLLALCCTKLHLAPLAFTGVVGCTSLWGPSNFVEQANTALVGLIGVSFFGLVATGIPHIDVGSLALTPDASALPAMLPVAVCALTFQNVVPAVSKNLGGDVKKIRSSLTLGSGLPLLTYIIWNAVVLGSAGGTGDGPIVGGSVASASVVDTLGSASPMLGILVAVFSMSAIITSFWGASFSLMIECTHLADRLASSESFWDVRGQFPTPDDASSIDEVARHDDKVKTAAAALVLLPPTLVSLACPDSFLTALQYVGVYVDPFLYGLAPAYMAFRLRCDADNSKALNQMPGGTPALSAVAGLTAGYAVWQTLLMCG